jgi:hypothetical protein
LGRKLLKDGGLREESFERGLQGSLAASGSGVLLRLHRASLFGAWGPATARTGLFR